MKSVRKGQIFHLQEVPRAVTFIEAQGDIVAARGWGSAEFLFRGCRVPVGDDGKVLAIDGVVVAQQCERIECYRTVCLKRFKTVHFMLVCFTTVKKKKKKTPLVSFIFGHQSTSLWVSRMAGVEVGANEVEKRGRVGGVLKEGVRQDPQTSACRTWVRSSGTPSVRQEATDPAHGERLRETWLRPLTKWSSPWPCPPYQSGEQLEPDPLRWQQWPHFSALMRVPRNSTLTQNSEDPQGHLLPV